MNSRERFFATVERRPVDRPAAWLGMPDIKAQPALFAHYGVKDMHELKLAVGDDFYAVEVPYQSPTSTAIYAAFDWYMDNNVDAEERTLTADGCFKDAEEEEDLAFFNGRIPPNILMWRNAAGVWPWPLRTKYAWLCAGLPTSRIPVLPLAWRPP